MPKTPARILLCVIALAAAGFASARADDGPRRRHAARPGAERVLRVRRPVAPPAPVLVRPADIILDVPQRTRDEDFLLDGTLMELFDRASRY